jgi:hypothetical protein
MDLLRKREITKYPQARLLKIRFEEPKMLISGLYIAIKVNGFLHEK